MLRRQFSSRNAVEMIFSCTTLDNKDIFSKTDPFIRISRIVESGGSVPICKTEVIDNNLIQHGNHFALAPSSLEEIKRKESDGERLNKMGPAPNIGVDHTPVKEDLKLINLSKPTKGQQ
ncbi:hypothetical protein Lal_00031792 [Lupinus albus]|nr:hypothetical protein Lal_00031792 [Lupinus albus]